MPVEICRSKYNKFVDTMSTLGFVALIIVSVSGAYVFISLMIPPIGDIQLPTIISKESLRDNMMLFIPLGIWGAVGMTVTMALIIYGVREYAENHPLINIKDDC